MSAAVIICSANYRNNIDFTAGSESLTATVLDGPTVTADIPTPSNEATTPVPATTPETPESSPVLATIPVPVEALSANLDTAGTSTMLEVTNVIISAAPVPPGKVNGKGKGKGKAMATVVGAGFTEKFFFFFVDFIGD
jgi:hypothetical protein